MENPIFIDLDNLTPELVNSCLDKMGDCSYSAPCIIGTLLTPEQRAQLDDGDNTSTLNDTSIGHYLRNGSVLVPDDQLTDVEVLQNLFDGNEREEFLMLVSKYVNMEGENVS